MRLTASTENRMWFLKIQTDILLGHFSLWRIGTAKHDCKRHDHRLIYAADSQRERIHFWLPRWMGSTWGKDWGFRISRWKLLHTEWINNKVLPRNRGNYIQYFVTNHHGKEHGRSMYNWMTAMQQRWTQRCKSAMCLNNNNNNTTTMLSETSHSQN